MKKIVLLFLLLNICILVFADGERGFKIVAFDPDSGTELNVYNESWAIIIGIDKYEKVKNLDYAVCDAVSMKNLLINKFRFREENIEYLTDSQATVQNIKRAFQSISQKSVENDRVVVFFAGHGETETLPSGGEMGYLIPHEGSLEDLYLSCLPMNELKTLSKRLPAKHVLFLVDACYGGLAAVQRRSLNKEVSGYIKKITKARARQIITAGSKDEQVIEKSEWGHSAFTYKLLDGLDDELADIDDDGFITAYELGMYIRSSVSKLSNNFQTPQFKSLTSDEGEFVFLLDKAKELFSKLVIQTDQQSADIFLDEVLFGKSPLTLNKLKPGFHNIRLETTEHFYESNIELITGQTRDLAITMNRKTGFLDIKSDPPNAKVYNNDKLLGKTPIINYNFPTGELNLEIKKTGYQSWLQDVELAFLDTLGIDIILKIIDLEENISINLNETLKEIKGFLTFGRLPEKTRIFADNEFIGDSSLGKCALPIGQYKIELKKSGYEITSPRIINIQKDQEIDLSMFQFTPKSSVKAGLKSMMLPGLGQIYSEKYFRGSFIILTEVCALGTGVYFYLQYNEQNTNYNSKFTQYNQASSIAEKNALKLELNDIQNDMSTSKFNRVAGFIVFVSVYAFNILDSFLWGGNRKVNLNTSIKSDDIYFNLSYRF